MTMIYDEMDETWIDRNGDRFILNEYDPTNPVYIKIQPDRWSVEWHNSKQVLAWPVGLDGRLIKLLQGVWKRRMRSRSPAAFDDTTKLLKDLVHLKDFDRPLGIMDFHCLELVRSLWNKIPAYQRPYFRTLVQDVVEEAGLGDPEHVLLQTRSWKAGRDLSWGKHVLRWDQEYGSLSSAELEIFREYLRPRSVQNEPIEDHVVRLYLRIALTLLRRTSQLAMMKADALRREKSTVGVTASLRVPLIKGQAGAGERYEPIPTDLADDIDAYRKRPDIAGSRAGTEVLLPLPFKQRARGDRAYKASSPKLNPKIRTWLDRRNIISSRTGEPMKITVTRLRHTGATHHAMQGAALDLIQDILQNDSPAAARYYIDAVGTEFLPVFEKVDRNLGGKFSAIRDAFFKGRIVDSEDAPSRPIFVPDVLAPAIVGACGMKGSCPVHPLFSCYSCQYFLAFRDADHQKTLDYVSQEASRWRDAEGQTLRTKSIKDFDRIAAGVRGAIDEIRREKRGD